MNRKQSIDIRKITYLALLSAIMVVLQYFIAPLIGGATGLTPSLVLLPIALGAVTCGLGSGAYLGALFALLTMIDPGTLAVFFPHSPFGTIATVLLKSVLSALAAGLVYRALAKKNQYLAICLSAVTLPVVNTSIFAIGYLLFFLDMEGYSFFALITLFNFIAEFVINLILVPVVYRLLSVTKLLPEK